MTDPARFRLVAGFVVVAGLALLVALCVRGGLHGSVVDGLGRLAADPWGLATLADLALGLLLVGAWMVAVEARPRRLLLWLPLLAVLGNIATGLYLLLRLRRADNLRAWLTDRA